MATKFLEPGGDATFNVATTTTNGFWGSVNAGTDIATDFVNGSHIKSIKYRPANIDLVTTTENTLTTTGSRISMYIYMVALPSSTSSIFSIHTSTAGADVDIVSIKVTSSGVLQLWNADTSQIGTNGSTLSTGVWYRISLAYTVVSTTVNEFRLFKNGVIDISVSNATIGSIQSRHVVIGNININSTLDFRSSDHYIDDSTSLIDTGNIRVTAKRPNANGTTNSFATQIGSGGSSYGTGHSPQVNERALSTTNGWSGFANGNVIEQYNIESASTGDINISTAIIVDYIGWVYTVSNVGESDKIILNNVTTVFSNTTANGMFTAVAGSTTYPAGAGKDIGIQTPAASSGNIVSLFECGIIVAYIIRPSITGISTITRLSTITF